MDLNLINRIKLSKDLKELAKRPETASAGVVLVFIIAALSSLFVSPHLYQVSIHEGDIALKNVYAPYDFTYLWGADEIRTIEAKKASAAAVPFYLKRDIIVEEETRDNIEKFFDIAEDTIDKEGTISDKIGEVRRRAGIDINDKFIKVLLETTDVDLMRRKTLDAFEAVAAVGYLDDASFTLLKENHVKKVVVCCVETSAEDEKDFTSIVNRDRVQDVLEKYVSNVMQKDRKEKQAVMAVLDKYIRPNLGLDNEMTEEKREEAVQNTKVAFKAWEIKKNELIIEKGKRVDQRNIAQITQMRGVFRPGVNPKFFWGILLLFLVMGAVAAIYLLSVVRINIFSQTKSISIILTNMMIMIITADVITRSPQPSCFIPLAGMGMMLTLLVGFDIAFISVLFMCVLLSITIGGGIELTLVFLAGSVAGMYAVRDTRRRSHMLWAGMAVGLANLVAICCVGLINGMEFDFYLRDGLWAVASGFLSAFLALGLLPLFEHVFKVPTNISLLEISDLNHPLLKKLAIEAPGTYHHSIMVGNLAEAACEAIGANSLLARVGAYYHDIGKIPKAEYFSENEMGMGSKHSHLAPSMSALIIEKHVKEGAEMARKYKLNNAIVDIITQHHGDSLISYFYQKALEKSQDGASVDEANFRYPGPKPQTKEGAIILLADSVEASSRALGVPTPSSIRNLVKKIINNKFIDNQFDACDLTLRDLNKIADSFVRVLMGVFHARLDYPEKAKKSGNGTVSNGDKDLQRKPKQKKKN